MPYESVVAVEQEYFGWPRDEMRAFLPARCGKVLEIGCGEGRFSGGIADAAETWGIEPHAGAARAAQSRFHKVINASFEASLAELPPRYFDTVICNDVIEHMPDHDWFLETIKTYMSPSGVLVGSIPNVRYYRNLFDLVLAKDWQYQDQGILDRTHLRFFTEKSLRRTLRAHGFEIAAMRGINGGFSRQALTSGVVACAAIMFSLGYFSDIRYLQFGFRASVGAARVPMP
ncbi:MAG TPA: class I SAM-dependent methyltransferase [Stellaceae bacterium]|jgi:2-polyprenyl-3-methyl-5-hydroxy-6-metoxy-1,4-benzoquinol methylase|nr:class I SAM-dependent methyltransferase [Stellaceae bacterium]